MALTFKPKSEEELNSYCQEGSKFIGLAEPIIPEIKIAGGSMGLGFPGAVGLALAKKLKGEDGMVYCLMSDGEMAIGTTWESALVANHHNLDNLIVIIDNNGLQAMGKTEDILKVGGLPMRGFHIDGHNYKDLETYLFPHLFEGLDTRKGPWLITCNTIKGKGVSFMEDNNLWHYKSPNKEEYNLAKKELNV